MPHHVSLFCEDAAHENFGRAIVERCAREEDVNVALSVPTARFGIPRLQSELRAFQSVLRRTGGTPDLLVVLVDANDVGVPTRKQAVTALLDFSLLPAVVIGVPDPYIERWFVADPASFADSFGEQPQAGPIRSRTDWKDRLVTALEAAGEIVTQGGAEFASEIVSTMDLYRAGQNAPSLDAFLSDLRGALRLFRAH